MTAYRASRNTMPLCGVHIYIYIYICILSRTHNMRFQNRKAGNKGKNKEERGMKSVHVWTYSVSLKNTILKVVSCFSSLEGKQETKNLYLHLKGINFHKKAARTSSPSFKTTITLQLTEWVSAYQHCDHLVPQLCLKAFLFAFFWRVSQSCIRLKMITQIQNPVLPRGVEVILEVNNIQIHSSSPHYFSAIM